MITGEVMAFLDLRDPGERPGQVVGRGTGSLGQPGEGQDSVAQRLGRDDRRVAADHPARLELLDPLVGRRPADADLRAELGVGTPSVGLEKLEQTGVDPVDVPSATTQRRTKWSS